MFSDKHWIEMLGLLGIPSKPVESLIFGDFLAAKENILSQAQALQVLYEFKDFKLLLLLHHFYFSFIVCDVLVPKDLNNRASSEIVIRQALTELDIWEVEARFQLVSHRDSRGSTVMLIKDFQDILNKVSH